MKVITAESAGFCFGVRRAVSICEKTAQTCPESFTLGPIIHNKHVISELQRKGVRAAADISDIPPGSTVIIRSHGIGKKEHDVLAATGASIIDATCPVVKKIHDIVSDESARGRLPVIIGERSHPEITAILGWCDSGEIFETAEELAKWLDMDGNSQKPVSVVFQTTNTQLVYKSCVEILKKVCTNYKVFDTICEATFKRQKEAEELSKIADVMIVVGGKNSANSLRLADICRQHCSEVLFVESAEGIENANIRASDVVGVVAGASTPAWIIKEVTQKMSEEVKFDGTQDVSELPENNLQDTGLQDPELVAAEPEAKEEPAKEIEPENVEEATENEDAGQQCAEGETAAELDIADDAAEACEPVSAEETEDAAQPEEPMAEKEIAPDTQEAESDASDEQNGATETFEEMLEKSIKTLHTGEKVTGIVTSITSTEVSVDLGTKQSGYIPIGEFTDEANPNIDDIIKVGDSIETFVMRVNDVEGMVMLSKKRLDAIKNWDIIEAAKESRAIVEGMVTEENKGGIVVNVKGVRVFIPASQTGLPKSSPMTELVKKTVRLRITEVNQSRRRVVGSIRAVQSDERRERSDRLWTEIEVGKQYSGIVKSMTSYGVFVDIGGVDGMIHISELSWTRIKQPSEVMSVGSEVSVYVLSFDKDNRKISLGYKKSEDNPWIKFSTNNAVGDVVNVKIVKMMPFGAFAEIIPGVDGLIHISQITDHRIGLPSEVLSNGQAVDVKITEIDNDRKKVSLSIRALIEPSSQPLTDNDVAEAMSAAAYKASVIVYDSDAPPEDDEPLEAAQAEPVEEAPAEPVEEAPAEPVDEEQAEPVEEPQSESATEDETVVEGEAETPESAE